MNWEGTGRRRSYIIDIPPLTFSGATKKNHEIPQSKQLISRPGSEEITSHIQVKNITAPLTCSTDACDRLDDGLPWYTLHCYGSKKKKKKTKREMLF
jgi:hypothetical protein